MKRKKEIELAWLNKAVQSNHKYDEKSFKEAVEWADKTMLDRACEWLRFRVSVDVPIETNEKGEPLADSWIKAQMERAKAAEEFIAEFRKAMKGE